MILINNRLTKLVLVVFVVMQSTGCDAKPAAKPATSGTTASSTSRPVSLISPVEFFPPEQKRLASHLNWYVGCFKIEYAGPAANLSARLETWSQGRPEPRGGSSSSMEAGMGEVSISVQENTGGQPHYTVKLVQSSDSGSASSGGGYNRPDFQGWSTRIAKIQNPTELKPGEEMAVWALCLFKSGNSTDARIANDSVFDQVKKSDWALVMKVGLNSSRE